VWVVLIGGGVAAYMATTPQDTPHRSTAAKKPARKKAADSLFTDADYKAKFEALNSAPKNAFMPVIMRQNGGGSDTAGTPNALPTALTGGEGGWAYTGTAEVDGRIQAVVENPGTGQGDFLFVGQRWKSARVVAITDSTLVLEGPSGQQVTIKMLEKLSSGSMMAGTGLAPVNPNPALRGSIGPISVRPTAGMNPNQGAPSAEGDSNAN
jgi:hypothetical protein